MLLNDKHSYMQAHYVSCSFTHQLERATEIAGIGITDLNIVALGGAVISGETTWTLFYLCQDKNMIA